MHIMSHNNQLIYKILFLHKKSVLYNKLFLRNNVKTQIKKISFNNLTIKKLYITYKI